MYLTSGSLTKSLLDASSSRVELTADIMGMMMAEGRQDKRLPLTAHDDPDIDDIDLSVKT